MNNYTVYCHTNKITGQKYIGITRQTVQQRWRRDGKGYSNQPKFYNAIKKYGWNNFIHEILYYNLSETQAQQIEQELIKQFNTIKNGYNIEIGGNVTHHTPETAKKISNSLKGKKHTQDTINKIIEVKQESQGLKVLCIELNKTFNSLGEAERTMSIDKSSISKCCYGKQITAGGYHWKFINGNNFTIKDKRKKQVRCINTNKIYSSISEAARQTGSDPSNIIKVCNGKYKTTNKLKWEWVEDV